MAGNAPAGAKVRSGLQAFYAQAALVDVGVDLPAIDAFLQMFSVMVEGGKSKTFTQIKFKEDVYLALGRGNAAGFQPVNRRVLKGLHPDWNRSVEGSKLTALRSNYEKGRDAYLRAEPHDQLEALLKNEVDMRVILANQAGTTATAFHYDPDISYDLSMGDVFFDPRSDRHWQNASRTVPGDLGAKDKPAGFIHAHFREYNVEGQAVRQQFIELCMTATYEQLCEFDYCREYAEEVLIDRHDFADLQALIDECEQKSKYGYLSLFGMWDGSKDEKVKQRFDEFLTCAPPADVYKLIHYMVPAFEAHQDLPPLEILEIAREQQFRDEAGDWENHRPLEDAEPEEPPPPIPPSDALAFGATGGWMT